MPWVEMVLLLVRAPRLHALSETISEKRFVER
jgi:hypothetical protein